MSKIKKHEPYKQHTYRIDPKNGRRIRWSKTGLLNPNGRGNFMNLKKRQRATRAADGTIIMWAPTKIGAKGTTNRRVLRETEHGYIHATKGYKSTCMRNSNPMSVANGWTPKAKKIDMLAAFQNVFGWMPHRTTG